MFLWLIIDIEFKLQSMQGRDNPGRTACLHGVRINFSITAVEVFLQVLIRIFKDQSQLFLTVKNIAQPERKVMILIY